MKKKRSRARHQAPRKKSNALGIVVAIFCVLLVAAYGAIGIYYSKHFMNGTLINNCNVSGMTLEQAKEALIAASTDYELILEEQDGIQESIVGTDIGLNAVISDEFDKFLTQQGGFTWVLHIFGTNEYTLEENMMSYTYDEDKLDEIIGNLDCVDPEYPVEASNAELVLLDGEFRIIPECESNIAHREELEEKIKIAVEAQESTINLREEGLYDEPTIFSDDPDLVAKKAICDEIVNMTVTLIFGYTEETVDIQTISTWVNTVKLDSGEYTLTANNEKITEYISYIADKYNTVGRPKNFATNGGDVVEISTGDYGWLLDDEYAIQALTDIVLAKQSVSLDLTDRSEESDKWWMKVAVGYDANGNDYYGTTYAEVSIEEQHMWMYQDGKVVLETDVVTGNPNKGNDTPVGAYRIRYKEKNATLRGADYVTPVSYWMVFTDDIGFHDATWQAAFGDERYLTNGSHGCVNMPLDQAAKLYDLIYDGMPVFVY